MNKHQGIIDQIQGLKPRFTVITPTYNRAELIGHTIKSVLEQDYTDYVYIILDDGSSDNTKEIVLEHIKNKDNCFYLYHENVGEAETVNIGWELAKGEYFLQVNSDDTIKPNLLSEMANVLDKNQSLIGAYSDFDIINKAGKVIEKCKNVEWNLVDALSAFSCYPAAPGAVIRKSAFPDLHQIKDPKYRYINDIKMLWGMALKGDYVYVPRSLASWRSHGDGISADRYKSIGEVIAWAEEFFSRNDLTDEVRRVEDRCRRSIYDYCARLIEKSGTEKVVVEYVKFLVAKNQESAQEIKLLTSQNNMLDLQNKQLEEKIRQLEQSTSWRITKPLRLTADFVKSITNLRGSK